jgi:phosphoglycolate phosphatase
MAKEFVNFYGKNIVNESTLVTGVKDFLIWCKETKYFNGCLHK